ncbi:uncharacterized protein [Dermacentor andersoni]|uniref:uncharacterized protein n=1 Tax=Dermacentor andersoni TaxID=34620 RepID=UPI003B3B1D42
MRLLVDTGASASLMTAEDFGKHFGRQHRLSKTAVDLKNFSKQRIDIQGLFQATVQFFQRSCSVTFHVTTTGTSLLGLDAIQRLGIQIDGTSLTCRLPSLSSVQSPTGVPPGFDHLSSDELGLVNNFVHRIHRQQDAKPVSSTLRRLPLALRDQGTHEWRRLEDCDVIERVEATEWVSPLVVVRKRDGTMRLCVDLREQDSLVSQVQEMVLQKQSQTKQYVDKRRGAQATRIKVGDTVRIRFTRKGIFKYSKPRKVKAQIGPSIFVLSDGKTWHVSKLTVVMKDPAGSTLCTSDRNFLYSYSNLDSHSDDSSVVTSSFHRHHLSSASDCIASESTQSVIISDSVGESVASQDLLGLREELPGQPSPALSDNHIQFSNQGEVNNSGTTGSTDTRRNPQMEALEAKLRASEDVEALQGVVQAMKELQVLHTKPVATDALTAKLTPQKPQKVAAHSCSSQAIMSTLPASQTHAVEVELEVDEPKVELDNIQSSQSLQEQLSAAEVVMQTTNKQAAQVLVVSDSNVQRIAGVLRQIRGRSVPVELSFKCKATTEKLYHLLQQHNDEATAGGWTAGALENKRQAQSHTSAEVRPECLFAQPGEAISAPGLSGTTNVIHRACQRETKSDAQVPPRRTRHKRSKPAYVMDAPHLPTPSTLPCSSSVQGRFSSADMGTTPGYHSSCNDPMASTQPQCWPRPLPNGWGHSPLASGTTLAAADQR